MRKILAFLFLLCACCVALPTYAMGTFSITREDVASGTKFIIHRTDSSFAQPVNRPASTMTSHQSPMTNHQ